jgi:hypothetical protein
MTAMLAARLLCGIAVLALESTKAAAQAQPAPVQRADLRAAAGEDWRLDGRPCR